MQNKDVVVEAVTGSGKTLAFVIPILEKLSRRSEPLAKRELGALIISPTRELATQIHSVMSAFLSSQTDCKLSHMLMIGGGSTLQQDIAAFNKNGPDILIGTPGRLEEFLTGSGKAVVSTKELEVLVMDEADKLLDMGFQQSVSKIISHLPKQRRTGLFSATMTDALSELVRTGLRNPVRVVVKVEDLQSGVERRTPASLDIQYLVTKTNQRTLNLIQLIQQYTESSVAHKFIVYFATGACVDYFYKLLSLYKPLTQIAALHSLHGQMPHKKRTATFHSFTSDTSTKSSVLLCTDVAARGIDLPDVDCVIQVDPPQDPKAFAHRCGRTGRAGRAGKAVVLLNEGREEDYVEFMKLRKIHMTPIETKDQPEKQEKLLSDLRNILLTDRDLHDKSVKAFVSFTRAYSKHEASFIFRLKDLDLGLMAENFALLRLPKMPELKESEHSFVPSVVDMDTYAYADKTREKQRQELLLKQAEPRAPKPKSKQPAGSWSDKQAAKDSKLLRQEKKKRKRDWLQKQHDGAISEQKNSDNEQEDDDWAALRQEEKLAKKVKRGKMSAQDMEALLNGGNDNDNL